VLAVYHALATGPQWEKTLLIIVYDEHGGFFDHVPPPEAPDDYPGMFGHYGVRVPALIVSPWVEPGSVSHSVFDNTTIIKTILLRFCPEPLRKPGLLASNGTDGQPTDMGRRVAHANDLGGLLSRTLPRPPPDRYALIEDAATAYYQRGVQPAVVEPADVVDGRELELHVRAPSIGNRPPVEHEREYWARVALGLEPLPAQATPIVTDLRDVVFVASPMGGSRESH
jgi:phosphoesterase family protein